MASERSGFWTEQRLIRTALAVLIAVAIGAIFAIRADVERKSMLLCGDFPGFYAPAVILSEGQGERLYDRSLQQSVEERFWPSMRAHVLVSVYPAFVGALLRPLAELPVLPAKILFALLSTGGIFLFARTGFPDAVRARMRVFTLVLLLLIFPPLLIALVGGQNTGITLGLLGLVLFGMRTSGNRAELLTGAALGLLLYKPQFGLLLLLPFLFWGRWRVLGAAAVVAFLLCLVPMPWTGADWFSPWLTALAGFAPENFLVNGPRMISPMALVETAAGPGFHSAGILLTGVLYSWCLLRLVRTEPSARPGAFAVFAALVAFLSPQALFYDLGIAAPLLVASAVRGGDQAAWRYFGLSAAAACAFFLLGTTKLPVFFFISGMMFCFEFCPQIMTGRRNPRPHLS